MLAETHLTFCKEGTPQIEELFDMIEKYLNGGATLDEFEIWLLGNLQRILDSRDETSIRMANQIDADLMELGEGLLDNEVFREHLAGYANQARTIYVSSTIHDSIVQELVAPSVSSVPFCL